MSQTVLIADDSKTIRQIVEMALKASTWEVVGVDSAQSAVQAARQHPSVILLDYYMPDGSGYDVCRQLKADASTSSIPVVMLGGSYKGFDEHLARQSGADGILMKPFKTDALLTAIEDAQRNGATSHVTAPAAQSGGLPVPQPQFDEEPSEPGYAAYGDSEPSEPSEPAYQLDEPSSEPAYAPEPAYSAEPSYDEPEEEEPRYPAGDATPLPQATSQPRIPTDPPQARHGSAPDINASSRQPVTPSPGVGGAAMSKAEIEHFIQEQVKATVRNELPGLLRTVMGEIFQQKVLPKLLEHAEARVKSAVSENLTAQIQNQVRVELERLLSED